MEEVLELDGRSLSLNQIASVAVNSRSVAIAGEAYPRMEASRTVVEGVVARGETAYGINTGFGKLSDVRIGPDQLESLQRNLLRSHACGIGEPLPEDEVRAMLLLRANVLAKGFSGVRPVVAET
ncbi:MAG TPA: aromatic amino acid lyase, partial [Silvibacterium sp.]|nr:aromatic amino acid lyase [Silvibacterium sp.]